ncbi:MAG: protease inhibitor I42 family protein [Phycisphaerales bacterium]|jgi:inhibitor of cysteine peptidase
MKLFIPLLLLILLSSCASSTKDGTEAINRPFSSVDSERDIVISSGRTFEIVLPSNPTTGYTWELEIQNPTIIKDVSSNFVADASGRIGVGGATTWKLRADGQGETALTFSYHRPWEEKVSPTKVVTFTISVR